MEKYELILRVLGDVFDWVQTQTPREIENLEEYAKDLYNDLLGRYSKEMVHWGDTLTHQDGTIVKVHHIGQSALVCYYAKLDTKNMKLSQNDKAFQYCYGYLKEFRKSTEVECRIIDKLLWGDVDIDED